MTIGFDQTAVTVLEGEIISLSTSIKNSELTIGDYLRTDFFEISTLRGRGNAIGSWARTLSDYYFCPISKWRVEMLYWMRERNAGI